MPTNTALPSTYQSFIAISRYARWLDKEQRRELWPETVRRYCEFFGTLFSDSVSHDEMEDIRLGIVMLEAMPSMRALMTAGEALARENLAAYNCAYVAVNNKRAFSEALYVLMCGTGVGFSCERQEIQQLPSVPKELKECPDIIVVGDSKEGWAKAFRKLISCLYEGDIPTLDYSKVRKAGARLKIFGGRASGPEPLRKLMNYTIQQFKKTSGRKLTSIEVHDLMCMIGEIVVVGGVRRSALISLSNLSDRRMQEAKTGDWRLLYPYRDLANNSVAYTEKPSVGIFMEEWLSLIRSMSGERGVFNREAAQKQAARWGRRSPDIAYGVNPCGEIILRDKGLCNLTEVVIRAEDSLVDIRHKVRLATIMGTMQATLTNFGFVGDAWHKNTVEERLLGVSLTGIFDHRVMSGQEGVLILKEWLEDLRAYAREVNIEWAEKLDITPSAAITCIKPSGTVSQLVDSASGIHPRHSEYYLRTVRLDKKDSLYQFLKDSGVYCEDEKSRPETTAVFYFPTKAPAGAVTRHDLSAIDHLRLWSIYQQYWCEHNPSITVNVREEEWFSVGAWVYENFSDVCGVTFLPMHEHMYEQAPYIELSKEAYYEWVAQHPSPEIDWTKFHGYESEDNTTGTQTLACSGSSCEIV